MAQFGLSIAVSQACAVFVLIGSWQAARLRGVVRLVAPAAAPRRGPRLCSLSALWRSRRTRLHPWADHREGPMPAMSRLEAVFCRSAPWRVFTQRAVLPWALQGMRPEGRVLEIG